MATITYTYDEFIARHEGKGVDYDGTAGVQCVDLAKCYLKEVFGISPGSWGNAHCYYDNYNSISALKNNFTRIANTSDFVPQKGDIAVWGTSLSSSGYGHIAICTGEGDTTYFYSYDQNWTGKHDACTKIKHTYKAFSGVLRAKDRTAIFPPPEQVKVKDKHNHTKTAIRIFWSKPSGDVKGYRVYKHNGTKWVKLKTIQSAGVLECRDSGLKAGTTYKYCVKAFSRDGDGKAVWGVKSATKKVTTKSSG